ncbi:MAG: cell division protein ZapD [Pseudomonadota bacterium]|nr:cell division protein ZapD [Pseudomonadota bacterium]
MNQAAEAIPQQTSSETLLLYEQPLNERMRTFLRLEFLYDQLCYHGEQSSGWSSRGSIASLLDVVAILSRGDIRGDVLKELERQIFLLDRLQETDEIDEVRLKEVLENLKLLHQKLISVGPKYLQDLRDNEFLNAIRHRSSIPGGTCAFDLPEYSHWLRQSYERRSNDIGLWIETVRPLCESVIGLLWLLRNSKKSINQIATKGVFQHSMPRDIQSLLVRVRLPIDLGLYPEISGGHHRFSIRFMKWEKGELRPTQTIDDVNFELTVC